MPVVRSLPFWARLWATWKSGTLEAKRLTSFRDELVRTRHLCINQIQFTKLHIWPCVSVQRSGGTNAAFGKSVLIQPLGKLEMLVYTF